MSREAHIPLVLWVSVALLAHLGGGGGAVQVARTIEDRAQIRWMVHALRDGLRHPDTTFEVLTELPPTPPPEPPPPPEKSAESDSKEAADEDETPDPNAKPEPIKDPKLAKLEPPKPEKPKEKPPEPKKEEKKPEPPKEQAKLPPLPPLPPPPMAPPPPPPPKVAEKKEEPKPEEKKPEPPKEIPIDKRLAVRQHVEKEQEDNPNAQRIADQANKVEEETMAEMRSKDQDDPKPTPGASAPGPKDKVGDSDDQKQAQSEDKAGDATKAPGEAAQDSRKAEHHNPAKESKDASPVPAQKAGPPPSAPASVAGGPKGPKTPQAEQQEIKGSDGGAGPASPEALAAERGGYTLDPANPGGDGKSRKAGKRRKPRPYQPPVKVGSIGLGAPGVPGAPNLNLSMAGVEAAVGHEKLAQERAAEGASRRSRHRGSWETNKWERWKAAIENYDPSVKPGNQTALNAARVPFATYINSIHNRLHPIFAEEFLASLDDLSKSHAFNNPGLVTHLEIVLSKDTGRIVKLGVTKTSGMTAFDIVALNSVHRASPFGEAPDAIVSPDGNVYLHWEFHRDPFDACTTRNARPFLLKDGPKGSATEAAPARKQAPGSGSSDNPGAPTGPLLPLQHTH